MGDNFGGEPSTALSVLLHLGSLVAILFWFRRDVWALLAPKPDGRKLLLLFIATLPAAVTGLLIKKGLSDDASGWVEHNILQSPWVAAFGLLFTAAILWLAERPREHVHTLAEKSSAQYWMVFLIGIAQMVAICPGVSRSGSTICAALMLRWVKDDAVRLSFLMGLIAIGGAGLLEARHIAEFDPAPAVAGFISSLIFSLLGLWGITLVVQKSKLRYFSAYCGFAGVMALLWLAFIR